MWRMAATRRGSERTKDKMKDRKSKDQGEVGIVICFGEVEAHPQGFQRHVRR